MRAGTSGGGWVYPRERGGTRGVEFVRVSRWGLSPRTRGNPRAAARHEQLKGSIPANAGEPSR